MSTRETVKSWFVEYANELDTTLSWDDDGGCAMEFEGGLVVEISASDETEGVHLVCNLVTIPETPADQHTVFQLGLLFNLQQFESLGGATCLSPDKKEILLSYSRPVSDFSPETFAHRLDQFVQTAATAKEFLNTSLDLGDSDVDSDLTT